ncbi:hypothetical protein EV356DRAFT_568806 [Viridothelium virens]|uniref:RED-like N-terminal domain-containing protein n=1 Tax=Viridothelium virens TaxID=1048519 RepID=A0A6A6H323_VIRVR|nr:hypothetical protein EV356DRAFT_568806 [Viridothelium virens]
MNNEQFRRLVSDTPARSKDGTNQNSKSPAVSLGSRMRSAIPMTPRVVKGSTGIDFTRQVAERDAASRPIKKFRSSVPKGSKLAAGYHDRTKDRNGEEEDDKAKRIRALEETFKLGQIDQELFEKLRDEIAGGDIGSTHLIKGLDRKLLERVRRGEDVSRPDPGSESKDQSTEDPSADIDDELEQLEKQESTPKVKQKAIKKSEMAPPPLVAGAKRNRDAILAELKAARKTAAQAKEASRPSLGPKFRKIGDTDTQARIERDAQGREVLITVDEDGNVKRKVRRAKVEGNEIVEAPVPINNTTPIGMEVPQPPPEPEEEEEDDIFEGIGTDYNPLAGLEDEDEDTSDSEEGSESPNGVEQRPRADSKEKDSVPSKDGSPVSAAAADKLPKSNNYFSNTSSSVDPAKTLDPMQDPTILAALKKVQKMKPVDEDSDLGAGEDPRSPNDEDHEREARIRRRAAMLATADRDLEDMDMGFGSSRFGDAEEAEEGGKVKLSEWKGAGGNDDDEGEGENRGGKKRKRGSKKKKGDKNSAADVMKVIESRKK